jgi:hypothetical protein
MGNVWRDLWPIYFGHWATPNIRLILRYKPHINGCTCTPLFDKIGPTNIAFFPVVLEKTCVSSWTSAMDVLRIIHSAAFSSVKIREGQPCRVGLFAFLALGSTRCGPA